MSDGAEPTSRSASRWSAEEWEQWYRQGRWYTTPTMSATASSEQQSQWGTRSEDPWQDQGDPWGGWWPRTTNGTAAEGRGGGADKIPVPEFDGKDDTAGEGLRARGYLRKVDAWTRVTRLPANKQALMLYNHLSGKAWTDAEELSLTDLDSEHGVRFFVQWIEAKYLDKEVVKVGRVMSEFFKVLKRSAQQDIRDFNQEFGRHAARLKEVGCQLPDVALAWWYLDKLRLDNSAELSLLSSTGNTYELSRLQEAAIIQDRMNRRMWESKRDFRRPQGALVTAMMEEGEESETGEADSMAEDEIPELDAETQEAYVAFQNAKAKYRAQLRARGTTFQKPGTMTSEERLKAAKAKSYCSVCKQKGHWHRDPICPMFKESKPTEKAAHTTHVVFFTGQMLSGEKLLGITDCACSRSLAGTTWLMHYFDFAEKADIPYFAIQQNEVFKFGGKKLFPSDTAWILWLNIGGTWMILKVAEVAAEVPLLLSRKALSDMKMKYDLEANVADFGALGLERVQLAITSSGHPALEIAGYGSKRRPNWPSVDWSVTETWIPSVSAVYMVRRDGHGGDPTKAWFPLFYPKDLTTGVYRMLVQDTINPETFLTWWHDCDQQRDFWVESEDYLDRIHVTPRKTFFDPRLWNTNKENVKLQLLSSLGPMRESTCVPCFRGPIPLILEHDMDGWSAASSKMLWVGRSRFRRKRFSHSIRGASRP